MELSTAGSRPRVEGSREREIFQATLTLLAETGYDRLTLDAVASRSRASKATLYRRWSAKAELVADALGALHDEALPPDHAASLDTGSLRGDLLALIRQKQSMQLDATQVDLLCGLSTAMHREPELAAAFRDRFIVPRMQALRGVLDRARDRGEIRPEADLDLFTRIVPAMLMFELTINGSSPMAIDELVQQVLEQVLLPALEIRPPSG